MALRHSKVHVLVYKIPARAPICKRGSGAAWLIRPANMTRALLTGTPSLPSSAGSAHAWRRQAHVNGA